MAQAMTSRQRMLAAIRNEVPDRVPVAPDISNMVPTRLSGRGYFAVYIHEDPPLWQAYIDAVRYYGIDGWFTYGYVGLTTQDVSWSERWLHQDDEKRVKEVTIHTPAGELIQEVLYSCRQPPFLIRKPIEDIHRDWPRFRHLLGPIVDADFSRVAAQRSALGELGVLGGNVPTPGFHIWSEWFQGGVETLSYLMVDRPALLDEIAELHHDRLLRELDYTLQAGFDFVLTGGSGSVTLASPKLWRKHALPTLKVLCERCQAAGVPTMIHSCGRQRAMVEVCARETTLNCINPLEIPPMGDITLAEAKRVVKGTHLSLMGNLHTTDVMLRGTTDQVRVASRQAIDDAAEGGGFVLSTGDQCGWATPDENIFAMVETAETYGRY
ncbi:MAG: hypothetical protein MUF84_10955 [Anaerolineae bacterium]|jgi:uroporphyrinogen decarboxylase|nr:hypothetical protein [Anaerolineae bacterium]